MSNRGYYHTSQRPSYQTHDLLNTQTIQKPITKNQQIVQAPVNRSSSNNSQVSNNSYQLNKDNDKKSQKDMQQKYLQCQNKVNDLQQSIKNISIQYKRDIKKLTNQLQQKQKELKGLKKYTEQCQQKIMKLNKQKDHQIKTMQQTLQEKQKLIFSLNKKINEANQQIQFMSKQYLQFKQNSSKKITHYQKEFIIFTQFNTRIQSEFETHKTKFSDIFSNLSKQAQKNRAINIFNQQVQSLKGLIKRCTDLRDNLQTQNLILPNSLAMFSSNQLNKIIQESNNYRVYSIKRDEELVSYKEIVNGFLIMITFHLEQLDIGIRNNSIQDVNRARNSIGQVCLFLRDASTKL